MSSKRIQVTVFIFLLLGTGLLYYRTFVTVNGRIKTLESALPAETDFEALILEEGIFEQKLDPEKVYKPEKVHKMVALLFDHSIPESPEVPDALHQVAQQARFAGIRGMSMATGEHRPAEAFGTEIPLFLWPIQLSFQSSYVQVAKFVQALQGMTRLTEVLKISMKREPPGVATELSLAVYSRTAPLPAKGKSKKKQDVDFDEMLEDEAGDIAQETMTAEMDLDEYAAE